MEIRKGCTLLLIVFLVTGLFLPLTANAQHFAKTRVVFKSGAIMIGSNGWMQNDSLTMHVEGRTETFPLNDLQLVEAKKGWAGKWALGCGGGCAVLSLITIMGQPEDSEFSTSELLASSALWVGIFAGAGYVTGMLTDQWNTVYISHGRTSRIEGLNFTIAPDSRRKGLRVGLSYKF